MVLPEDHISGPPGGTNNFSSQSSTYLSRVIIELSLPVTTNIHTSVCLVAQLQSNLQL